MPESLEKEWKNELSTNYCPHNSPKVTRENYTVLIVMY